MAILETCGKDATIVPNNAAVNGRSCNASAVASWLVFGAQRMWRAVELPVR
ncbi:hypothetical protein [Janthinobacterium sp. HLX7-2]|uniref:hypothetical protein n=1 Tax=Janthinobacterium sp. HLX7-2 TaxID=1259331 RepID=UPI003F2032AF